VPLPADGMHKIAAKHNVGVGVVKDQGRAVAPDRAYSSTRI